MTRYRKKPVEIDAVQFTGDNVDEVLTICAAPHHFRLVDAEDRGDDPDITAEVFDRLHSTWVGVKTGQWVLRGIQGETYPCDADVFTATYDRVGTD